ncbi:1-(5-phosphoribosyl)-5-[(5-phosphoribosylamino)methylideneamino]imidazole-4-carboxamide isomerase [Parvularcula sp. LCG005]|uniref:1-(5-phosphoribosyl)-5-[(5- phosphoribosylamino)methylideneamino]imidazole-4- carboxamide isomerase n=1 Tax=Parvularcula sp. LCG005 TaxID=3078805 RepID=UPI002942454C|nr:1-(5-phosphoribosyl)-5-[(5-phosphoribosylamino)methylideneamino]imidazole-4-carboxamide isomerase [Parvularcula sp. LCG005]WOI53544.1 1-(5-phosphoribosyl)-5-[(5-phosphoribosylamino)methylideneamino]imidazole-4-carboxamide isomerase [Parvularcula sp. LCG005]
MSFALWPAIDLKGGKCVRLLHGDMEQSTTYADNPAAQAWKFRDVGFGHLHVVDLDGAFAGKPENADAVEAILYETDAKVQLGGGIRDLATVERWLSLGVTRVILGTAAVKDPDFVHAALKSFPGRIVLGIDAKDGFVATDGWGEKSTLAAKDVIARYDRDAIAAIVYTDISRDGALTGANVSATQELASAVGIPVLASGGVAALLDLELLAQHQSEGVCGAILGRSLYEGTINPLEALALERS